MTVYRVQGPDGAVHRFEGPENATSQQVEAFAAEQFSQQPKPAKTWDEKVAFERGKLQEANLEEMGPLKRLMAGFGKSFTDTGQGLSQLAGRTSQAEVDQERKLSQPLMDDPAAIGGNLLGSAAQTAVVPGGSTLKGAMAVGGALAGAQPVATGESRAFNTGVGAALGGAGQGVARVLGKTASGPKNVLTPAEQELVAKAEAMGIQLTPGQKTGNRFLQTVESQMERMPATSAKATEQRVEQGNRFTKAVTRTFGENADNVGEDVMSAAKARLGKEYDRIFANSSVELSPDVALPKLSQIVDEAITALPKEKAAVVNRQVDAILGKVDESGGIAGKAYQKWRSGVKSTDGDINHYLKQVKGVIDEAAQASLGQENIAALKSTNQQYKNMKTVQPLAAGSASGQVPAGQLMARVKAANPNMAYEGAGEIGDLAKIGSRFVRDQTPDSGTSQRKLAEALLSGGGGGALMGTGAYLGTGDMGTALQVGAGTAATRVAAPKIAQALLSSPKVQRYLAEGGLMHGKKVDPRLIELLLKGSSGAPVGGWLALSQ